MCERPCAPVLRRRRAERARLSRRAARRADHRHRIRPAPGLASMRPLLQAEDDRLPWCAHGRSPPRTSRPCGCSSAGVAAGCRPIGRSESSRPSRCPPRAGERQSGSSARAERPAGDRGASRTRVSAHSSSHRCGCRDLADPRVRDCAEDFLLVRRGPASRRLRGAVGPERVQADRGARLSRPIGGAAAARQPAPAPLMRMPRCRRPASRCGRSISRILASPTTTRGCSRRCSTPALARRSRRGFAVALTGLAPAIRSPPSCNAATGSRGIRALLHLVHSRRRSRRRVPTPRLPHVEIAVL